MSASADEAQFKMSAQWLITQFLHFYINFASSFDQHKLTPNKRMKIKSILTFCILILSLAVQAQNQFEVELLFMA